MAGGLQAPQYLIARYHVGMGEGWGDGRLRAGFVGICIGQ
jgi:hypothetical protein